MIKLFVLCVFLFSLSGCANQQGAIGKTQNTDLRTDLKKAERALQEARLLDAEVIYRRLTETKPDLPDIWLRLGNIYARQGKNEAAIHTYSEGLNYQRNDGRLWYNLSVIQVKEAIKTLEDASHFLKGNDDQMARIRLLHNALLGINNQNVNQANQVPE
ncbi:hypothetical protein OR573_01285 [Halomonas sp. CH40]